MKYLVLSQQVSHLGILVISQQVPAVIVIISTAAAAAIVIYPKGSFPS